MILDDLKVIFFHPGKTGGSTIEHVLGSYSKHADLLLHPGKSPLFVDTGNPGDYALRKKFMMGYLTKDYAVNDVWQTYLQHADIEIFERLWGEENFDGYYKFAFVRNPYDRLLSIFFYNGINNEYSFEAFIKSGEFEKCCESSLSRKINYSTSHFTAQNKFTHLNNLQQVNFIGRFENFDQDFHHVLSILGLRHEEQFPMLAKTKKSSVYHNYMDAYDNEMLDTVYKVYACDFDTFGYSR